MDLEDKSRVRSLGLQIELAADSIKMSGHIINKSDIVYYGDELRGEISRIEDNMKGLMSYVDSIRRIIDPELIIEETLNYG